MLLHTRTIMEEIHYYEDRNNEMEIEDLLLKVMGEKPINEQKIKDNQERIDKLWWELIDI